MAISLKKGGKISLAKVAEENGVAALDNIRIGLGWDTNQYSGGGDFDLDASVFVCGADGKALQSNDGKDGFVFYGNTDVPGVHHTGDNKTGAGEGDDEVIEVTLSQLMPEVEKIATTVTIYEADKRKQNFGMVSNAYIRLVDVNSGAELLRYDLGEDYSVETGLVVAELYKRDGEWRFSAIGMGYENGLLGLCKQYGVDAE